MFFLGKHILFGKGICRVQTFGKAWADNETV